MILKKRCCVDIAFQLCFEFTIWKFQANQDGLKLICSYEVLAYVDDVNILGVYALSGSGYIKVNRNPSIRINALVL